MDRLQNTWRKKFNTSALERGETAFKNGRVVDFTQNGDAYSAAVLDRERHEVSLTIKNRLPIRMTCHCPTARSGNNCYHMAALVCAIDALDHQEEFERQKQKELELRVIAEAERIARERAENVAKEEAERAKRREARERRKAERAKKEAEQKAAAEAERQRQLAQQQAEEKRREALRQQKKAEDERRREKKRREQEAARAAAAQKLREEEAAAEKQRKKEERARKAEEKRKAQEAAQIAETAKKREKERQEAALKQEKKSQNRDRMTGDYAPLGEVWQAEDDTLIGQGSIESLNNYTYFDGEAISNSLEIPAKVRRAGENLYLRGVIDEISVTTGYESGRQGRSELVGEIIWKGTDGKSEIRTDILFSRNAVRRSQCNCPACRKNYSWYWEPKTNCEYTAGTLIALRDFLNTRHNFGDATDWNGDRLLSLYEKKRQNLLIADKTAKEESLTLQPRLVKKGGSLTVSFKIGAGRLFVIKQLDEFCKNVRTAATATYGSNTKFNHQRSNFTDEGKKWLRFIERIVQEEEEFCERLEDATRARYYYQKSARVGGSLNMFGWRLDEFYKELGDGTVEYEDRDAEKTKKALLRRKEDTPRITLQISEADLDETGNQPKNSGKTASKNAPAEEAFHGILVSGHLPELYFGMNCAYYINGNYFCRSVEGFQEKIETLAMMADEDGDLSFRVGRNYLSEFYYQILPELQDVAEVIETNPDRIHSFLIPPVHFVFYLDADGGDVQCRPYARYEQEELSLLDFIRPDADEILEPYRNYAAEQEMLYRIMAWMPQVNPDQEEISCGEDEELIYRMMTDGVDELLGLGEVQCTTRFRAKRKIRPVKVSVGVSVSSGLLDLDITTDDVPPEELLDILNSYREKKNYYRLKDGSYVDLDLQSLELLSELMDSMHVKPKDFVRGKMHLPLYRTLYLNKMLEENDGVYSDRDSHFREMVKEFKTIGDANFDVPASLSKTMRKYQKDGYKWLRTLETWQFGGILADDMGLGKTLQVIALLLSAKERRHAADAKADPMNPPTSLVIAPASLVFNWGEEFARFAPDLHILLITGTQAERQEKIASCMDYDVAVTSYDLLKRDIDLYEGMEFEYEVIDEAQYIKNHTTAAAKAVKVIKSRYHFALTGTPIENRLSELWSIFDILMPGFLYTYEVFKREIETPIVKYQDEAAMARLQKMTGPFILRRLKEDVLKDLPDKLEEVRYVRLDNKQQQLYDGQVLHMRQLIASQDSEEFNRNKLAVLTELMRLRQICCDPSLCFDSYRGESAKADACMDLITSAIDGGHRMLLFSQFTSMLEILKNRLDREEIAYYTITGATSKQQRLELVKKFNAGDTPVFLISLKAGGVGLNLTGADVVIHYDPWWNVAAQNQATDRAHRIGQTKKVTVFKLIVRNSIEEKILKLQETKKDLADQVISGETGQLAGMTRDDFLELLE